MEKPLVVFCCYARRDQEFLLQLKTYLRPLVRDELIIIQADIDISPGEEWEKKISHWLNTAHMILLLIGPDFMASDYCYSKEMMQAMKRHEDGEARVIPIILRQCLWQGAPFGKLQALPKDAKPVTDKGWGNRHNAFINTAQGIQKAANELKEQLATAASISQQKDTSAKLLEGSTSTPQIMILDRPPKTKAQWLDEGYALWVDERYEEALAVFEQVLRLDPHDEGAWYYKGSALYHFKRYDEALAAYEQVIQLDANYLLAYLAKGWVLYDLGRPQEAFAAYDQAIQHDPNYARAYNDKSVLLRASRHYFQALEVLEQAIRLKPDYTYAYLNKGLVLDDLERYHEALAVFEQALQHDPGYARAYYEKGRVLKKLGRSSESQQAYEKASQLGYNR